MKKVYLLIILMFVLVGIGLGQTIIHSESFESAPQGSNIDYSIDSEFGGSDPNDYFQRITITGNGKDEINSGVTGGDGSYMIAGEDIDGASPTPKVITIVEVSVTGYSNITISAFFGSGEQNKYDAGDYIKLFVKKDGGSEELIAAFYGYDHVNGDATNGRMYEDEDLDGSTSDDSNNELSKDLTEYTYSISGVTNTLQVIVKLTTNSGDEVLMLDNVKISGISSGSVANPTDFTATTVSTSEIDLSWTQNGNGDDVMVAWSSDGTFGTPTDGTTYAAGDAIPGGGTVLYNGSNTSFNHTGLTSGTQYFYKAWSVDAATTYSSGVTGDATTYKDEPSNHVSSFAAGTPSATSIPLTWNDNDGAVAADYFLVMINTTGTFTAPVDGTPQADDTDVSDGAGVVNVAHGDEAYTWTNLAQGTHYYFTIYPYTNSGSAIDYKTDGSVPTADATTTTANTGLIISEVADPSDHYQGRFVEIYNLSSSTIDFGSEMWYLVRQAGGGSYAHVQLTGTLNSGEAYTIGYNDANFNGQYGFSANLYSSAISGNGDDGYFLYFGGDETTGTLIDAYGVIDEDGTGTPWEYLDGKAVRKRSVGSPNSTWTASEWVITRPADVVNMTPGQHSNYVTWQGTTDQYWDTKTNWDNGFIPDASMNVTLPSTSNNPVIAPGSYASCWDLTVDASATLTVKADASGQGSLIAYGSASGNVSVENYVTAGQWHGVSSPVSGETAAAYYLNGSPNVWLKEYNESDRTYTYITSLSTPLDDMKGRMMWIGGTAAQTFTLTGPFHTGTLGATDNMVRSQAGADYGYNFVGNPFTSTIDWDAPSGWTKTNMENAVYVYDNGVWATYVGGTGNNGGSRYIAMNQGFFVQVTDGNSTGTLQMTNEVCVHNSVDFLKSAKAKQGWDEILRLQVTNGSLTDETVIKLTDEATEGWDGALDAHKLFSFNPNHPQIFSAANGKMAINALPHKADSVALDVTGDDGDSLTISATQYRDFAHVYLTDHALGITADLTKGDYSFTYDAGVTDRFTVHFTLTGVNENSASENYYSIFASNGKIHVVQPEQNAANITVFNLLGQKVTTQKLNGTNATLPVPVTGYYLVQVSDGTHQSTKKVFVK